MSDTLTPTERSKRMSLIKSKGTRPELTVRQLVHGLGYRYRLHVQSLPGTPDLVLKKYQAIIFVHGCFWHRHSLKCCKLARLPKSRVEFWASKLEQNRTRDLKIMQELDDIGWRVLTLWECELSDPDRVQKRVESFLRQ